MKKTENNSKMESSDIFKYLENNNYLETIIEIVKLQNDNFSDENIENTIKSFDKLLGAIDIGYGNTKYSLGIKKDFKELKLNHFPSLAPIAPRSDMSGSFLGKRNTKIIDLNGNRVEVGPDTEMTANGSDSSRLLNESYIFSENYHALFLGALSYMDVESLDVLIMGLPVKYMYNAEKIIKKFTGEHILADNKKCHVEKIVVIPQPLGGFYDIAIKKAMFEEMINEVNLIIDPGYLTFDFLLLNGLTPIENRSNAIAGGMSRILNKMAQSISQDLDRSYDDYNAIDKALRTTKKVKNEDGIYKEARILRVAGKNIDLLKHIKNTSPVIESAINYMSSHLFSYDDIDNIALVGGPENIFEKKIKEHLVDREILKSSSPLYSNVSGFWFFGLILLIIQTLSEEGE